MSTEYVTVAVKALTRRMFCAFFAGMAFGIGVTVFTFSWFL